MLLQYSCTRRNYIITSFTPPKYGSNNCDKNMIYVQAIQYTLDKNRTMKNDFFNGQITKQTDM